PRRGGEHEAPDADGLYVCESARRRLVVRRHLQPTALQYLPLRQSHGHRAEAANATALRACARPLRIERYCQEWCTRADQAATLLGCCFLVTRTSFFTSIPSRNLTPSTTFASHSKPRS